MNDKYSYQIPAAQSIYDMAISQKYSAVVLASACNSGKSSIVVHILNMFFQNNPELKVIVLTHNQNLLKNQMLEGFQDGFVKPNFTFGVFGSNSQVEVGIPSSRAKINACDVLVVDEGHEYFGCMMIESIIQKHKPQYEILMTGSPGIYNKVNKNVGRDVYGMFYISGGELAEKDIYSDVVIDVIENGTNVIQSYTKAISRLKTDKRFDDSKLMVACKTTDDAYNLGLYLRTTGRKIAISTAANDKENMQVKRFKSGEADTLIVVNKGILGFSDDNVTGLIDLKCSSNIDSRNQLFARILRKHPKGLKKFYIAVVSKKDLSKEIKLMYDVVGLMKTEVFKTYI